MEYMKINTLWMREENGKKKGRIIPGQFSCPEFDAIKYWHVTEKVDGTNMRVNFVQDVETGGSVISFAGKTDDAELYAGVEDMMRNKFFPMDFKKVFPTATSVTLFGEAFGGTINQGYKTYGSNIDFVLFDVNVDGWYLEPDNVVDIGDKLNIDHAPWVGEKMTVEQIIEFVKSEPMSAFSTPDNMFVMEGVVCRSVPQMLFRKDKKPIMFKLKCNDYRRLRGC